MSAEEVDLHEVEGHHECRPRVLGLETSIDLVELPRLPCLPLDLGVLKGTFNDGAARSCDEACCNDSSLHAEESWDRLTHGGVVRPPRVDGLKHRELHTAVDYRL